MGDNEVSNVISLGKFSTLSKASTEDTKRIAKELGINEIKLQKGLWLTSTSDGIFLHITTGDKTRISKLDPEASDPLVLSLYEWAQKLVDDRTYNN